MTSWALSGGAPGEAMAAVTGQYREYYWTWYDSRYSRNWVLLSNPASQTRNRQFELSIMGEKRDLSTFSVNSLACPEGACAAGHVPPGRTIVPAFEDLLGGPVIATSLTGDPGITSQRILWHGESLEEVPGLEAEKRSSHVFWTWYDGRSPGFTDWVMITNPNGHPVYYEIAIARRDPGAGSRGTIAAGESAAVRFDGVMDGLVDLRAWNDNTKAQPAEVIASQRVLTRYGEAFNEVHGVPESELSDSYLWTWYDARGSGGKDWVLVANPNDFPIFYEITIAGGDPGPGSRGVIAPGGHSEPTFPGIMGGPLELRTWTDTTRQTPAVSVASQRVIWGPSFEEVPGYPAAALGTDYHWTWYDQQSAGARNWVLVANPGRNPIYYEMTIGGHLAGEGWSGTIPAGQIAMPSFPGRMDGPVEVKAWTDSSHTALAPFLAAQRVLWSGHFNEVVGTSLPPDTPAGLAVPLRLAGSVRDTGKLTGADGLDVDGGHAFVVSGFSNDMTVIDIADPASPRVAANLTDPLGRLDRPWGITVSGNRAYIAAGFAGDSDRLTVVDVSDPVHPFLTGSVQDHVRLDGALHVCVQGQYAYITAPQGNRVTIVDISDPARPRVTGSVRDDTLLYAVDGIAVSGNHAFVTSHQLDGGTNRSWVSAIDISDPTRPVIVGALNSRYFRGGDQMYISGRYMFVPGNLDHTFSVIDISDPAAMRILSHVTDHAFIGQSCFIDSSGHYAFLTSADNDRLTVIDISDVYAPRIVGSLQDSAHLDSALYVIIAGGYAYVTSPTGTLSVIEVGGA